MSDKDMERRHMEIAAKAGVAPLECSTDLRNQGKPYPRTCYRCGLGPCNKYQKQEVATTLLLSARNIIAKTFPFDTGATAVLVQHIDEYLSAAPVPADFVRAGISEEALDAVIKQVKNQYSTSAEVMGALNSVWQALTPFPIAVPAVPAPKPVPEGKK